MHILIKDTSWHIWVSKEGHDINIWQESFLWRNSFVITYATSAWMGQLFLWSSFALHTCVVLNYLYPFTRNIYLKYLKYKQHITRQLMRSLAFKDHMFCNLLKAEICFLKYCIYCENYIFSDLLHCAFVKIHKANIIIQKYCQIRFGSCTELFNGSESFQFSFFPFNFISVSTILHFFLKNPNNWMKYDDLQQLWSW